MSTEENMAVEATTLDETTAGAPALAIATQPAKRAYKPGEAISYVGATFAFDGADVTDSVSYSVPEGTTWKSDDKELVVVVTYAGAGAPATAQITLRRKRRIWPLVILIAAVVAASTAAAVAYNLAQPKGESGSYLIPQGDMTDEEAQALVNEMAEKSRINISVAPNMELRDDGALRINFIVVPNDNNDLSERIEIVQDGNIVLKSDIVKPGYKMEWGSSNGAHLGDAVATIYAVDANGADSGNPVSVEVQIVEPGYTPDASTSASGSSESSSAGGESAEAAN